MKKDIFVITASVILFTGCGGGGGGENTPSNDDSGSTTSTGIFTDSPVQGLSYKCGDNSGHTNADGEFNCNNGEYIEFLVGNVSIGKTVYANLVSPIELVDNGSTRNPTVQNILRFLQMLDKDSDPTNGIEITQEVREVAANWQQIDFSKSLNFNSYISDAASVDNTEHILPDANTASQHLENTLGISPYIQPGCSIVYPESPFCNAATNPTCDTKNVQREDIVDGISYSDVVKIMGCHGVLSTASSNANTSIAVYSWGSSSSYDWAMTFIEDNGRPILHNSIKY